MCFNDAAKPGVLRLNVPEFQHPLPSIGTFHWALGLYGVSVGSENAEATFCDKSTLKHGQKTPCGAIPDSGTTLMMGPKDQVSKLFGSLCNNWERCRTARKGEMKNMSASHAFQALLYHCGSWMTNETGIDEVPSMFLTVGSESKQQKLEITPWAYIVETMASQYNESVKYLLGVLPVIVQVPTGKTSKVCIPSVGTHQYNTQSNG